MLETNKQAFLFDFREDLSYFVILRYKLRDLIKIYDDFSEHFVTISDRQELSLVEYKWLWLHTTRKRLLGLSFMIDDQRV